MHIQFFSVAFFCSLALLKPVKQISYLKSDQTNLHDYQSAHETPKISNTTKISILCLWYDNVDNHCVSFNNSVNNVIECSIRVFCTLRIFML